jgi:site-specific DNA-cytosine methylase
VIGMTVCSGIGAPEVAAPWIDWRYQSEIEKFPAAVLAHRFPNAVNLGDMTKFQEWPDAVVNVLVGGTPCQSFSVAGLRKGLDDPRGNLMLTYLAIARRYRPKWLVWENVPGVLSSNGGRDFGAFLRGLGELGYGFAYRVLDAQFVRTPGFPRAVPQRRRRVFVVGCLGDWRRAAAVLFDAESMSGHPAPRREAGQRPAPTISARPTGGGGLGTDFDCDGALIAAPVASTLNAAFGEKQGLEDQHINSGAPLFVAHSLRGDGFDASARPKKAKDGEPKAFLDALVGHDGSECVLWPFGRFKSGYGCVGKNGRAHRMMCEMAHGSAPDGADAAHSCGNRLCVNPNHLRWASRAENMADAIRHGRTTRGERHGASKLTADAVWSILARLDAGETHQGIADSFGVSRNAITDIAKGKNWSWLREDGTGRGTPPVAIQERAVSENPDNGPDGKGWRQDGAAYTLEARNQVQAVVFGLTTEQTPKFAFNHALTLTKQSPTGGGQPQAVCTPPRRAPPDANRVRAPDGLPRPMDADPVAQQARRPVPGRPAIQGARELHRDELP